MRLARLALFCFVLPCFAFACGDDDDEDPKGECTLGDNSGCGDGMECQAVAGGDPMCFCSVDNNTGCADQGADLVCEVTSAGNSGCFAPIHVQGIVRDLATKNPIAGAAVVARDANNAAISGISWTDAAGAYSLRVPAKRDADGKPLADATATLRADAAGYVTFPKAPRVALPVFLSGATGEPLTVESSATDIYMLPLQNKDGLGSISGKVLHESPRGTLVVAGGTKESGGGVTGVADFDGAYTVFNVPAGSVTVSGYKIGLQLESKSATVKTGEETTGVDLASLGGATATVSGKVEIVNAGQGKETSIILAVAETFDRAPNIATGEAPPGLRVYPVLGAFSISGVPDGNYVALAAFENDFLVRDPDTSIGGTAIVEVTVAGQSVELQQSFKVTGALDLDFNDGATRVVWVEEKELTGKPEFVWNDDSGEDHYEIAVFDAYGKLMWEDLNIPSVSGSKSVKVTYGGTEPLVSGVLYQFRATSIKGGGTPLSRTENLRGTFLYR
jgi:hypothetical protein